MEGSRLILTEEQQDLLNGISGPVLQKYMQWLVRWGTAMKAERLIDVHNVHASGLSAPGHTAIGMNSEAVAGAMKQVEEFTQFKVKVPTSSHISRITTDYPEERGLEPDQLDFQKFVIERARKAGIVLTWTCAPYIVGVLPGKGQICAWTESSAVVYVNSIIGARSTRNGQESAIAASVLGWVPEFGVLKTENRKGNILITVETELNNSLDYGLAGYFAGDLAGLDIGKQISAALATSGGVTMFHAIGITPEASTREEAFQGEQPKETHVFDERKKKAVYDQLHNVHDEIIDHVMIGCPHATLEEIRLAADLLQGRKINDNIRLEVWTPRAIRGAAEELGFVQAIEDAGGRVLSDTCPAVSRISQGKAMATHSCKQAHYSKQILGNRVALGTIEQCVMSAVEGRWLS
jgi:predicted aconitase